MNYGGYPASALQNAVAFASADVRAAFIRKVYSLFFVSILVTVFVGAICAEPSIAPTMLGIMPILWIGTFLCVLALSFMRRASGLNLFLLYLFAALQGAILGPYLSLLNQAAPGVPAQAAILTATVFAGLTMYAFVSGKDFSFLGGMLFVALIVLVVAGFLLFFFHSPALYLLYSVAGVLIFCGWILYDTSRIIHRLQPGEEVVGAVSLYLDLLNLFLFILRLMSNRRN
jgi:FtsH-binding integral membrane protein